MGKTYKGNNEYARKFKDCRANKKVKGNKLDRRIKEAYQQDDMWLRSGQYEQ